MIRLLLFILLFTSSLFSFAQVHVLGYYRKNGTYVQPHERTRPNHTVTDNYSYPGNYNPNTGSITGGSTRTSTTSTDYTNAYTPSQKTNYTPAPASQQYTPTSSQSIETVTPTTFASDQLYAETEPNAALKVEPNYMANSRYAIPTGATVRITKYDEYYYRADVDGRSGYVCTCQVKRTFTSR